MKLNNIDTREKMKKFLMMLSVVSVMILMGASCSTTRQTAGSASGNAQTSASIGVSEYAQYGDWKSLVSSGKVSFAMQGGKSMSSSMQMKMVNGRSISISIRPLLGIEVARVYISDDEIVIIDRIHKVYVKEKASLLTSGVPVDVATLQDLMLGRPHILGKGTFSASMSGEVTLERAGATTYLLPKSQFAGFTYKYTFDEQKNVTGLEVAPAGGQSVYSVKYGDVETTLAGKVSTKTTVDTEINGKSLTLDMTLKSLTWNTDFADELEIPSGYSQSSGSSIIKALGGTIR